MMQYNRDLENLGRSIQEIVDRAVNARDYERLNQTIRQAVGKAVDLGSDAVRRAAENASVPVKTNHLYTNTGGKTARSILKLIFGLPLFGLMILAFIGALMGLEFSAAFLGPFVVTLIGLAGGGRMSITGIRTLQMVSRFRTYRKMLGNRTQCALVKLARSVGRDTSFVRRDLRRMIQQGYFLEGHMDKEENHLITSDETYKLFEQSRLQLEARQREAQAVQAARPAVPVRDPQLQDVLDRGNAFVAQIRKCNDDIPGEEVSAKIDRMEQIVRRIFRRAEEHPEIIPDLKKLMDYYLPMTVKLLNAYADMDAQPVQGENILSSKREIEDTLDTLNLAFEKLLDNLFADTVLDVSSDISVLNTMLAQEGLTEDELTRMRKQQM